VSAAVVIGVRRISVLGDSVRFVRQVLSVGEFNALASGELTAPDGRVYRRRTTRMKRKEAAALVEATLPVVVYQEGGELVWHDSEDAQSAWTRLRAAISTEAPDPRRRESVTAGRWDASDGAGLLVLLRHH
jgi:hypothetical protein